MKLARYVNIDVGTCSEPRMSNGNTLPFCQVPFGMQAVTLESSNENMRWFYKPYAKYCEGVRISHQPSPWIADYGFISILPIAGETRFSRDDRCTAFLKDIFTPSEMQFSFIRYQTKLRVTPAQRGFKFTFDSMENDLKIVIDLGKECKNVDKSSNNSIQIAVNNAINNSNELRDDFIKYYAISFDEDIDNIETENIDGCTILLVSFKSKHINMDIASSFISSEQAIYTLNEEIVPFTYDAILEEAIQMWEKYLSKVLIEGTDGEKEIFYTNMYRCFLFPHKTTEIDEFGEEVHYNFHEKTTSKGKMIADNGFWDTFKTLFPFLSIVSPEDVKYFVESILNMYDDSGWLPRWMAPYEVGCMPSTLVDSVVGEAFVKGIIGKEEVNRVVDSITKNATIDSGNDLYGRKNLSDYIEYGYLPSDDRRHTLSSTLDYAYCDYILAKVLEKIGKNEEANHFMLRSKNYKNVFSKEEEFFVAKDRLGKFRENFDPYVWGWDYCESSAWQNAFSVLFDDEGLIELHGGKAKYTRKLDELFNQFPKYNVGHYGHEIHEILEMGVLDLGQFAISNQPSFHLPHMYLIVGEHEKFRAIMEKTFKHFDATVTGYPGDEDNGSMSSWFVLNAIGLYSLDPISTEYFNFPSKYSEITIPSINFKNTNNASFSKINYEELMN